MTKSLKRYLTMGRVLFLLLSGCATTNGKTDESEVRTTPAF